MQNLVVRWRYCTEGFDYLALAALIEVGACFKTVCSRLFVIRKTCPARIAFFASTAGYHLPSTLGTTSAVLIENSRFSTAKVA